MVSQVNRNRNSLNDSSGGTDCISLMSDPEALMSDLEEPDKDDKVLKEAIERKFPFLKQEIKGWNLSTRVWRKACEMREANKNNVVVKVAAEGLYASAGVLGAIELPVGLISSLLIANPLTQGASFSICALLDSCKLTQLSEGSHTSRFEGLRDGVNHFVALNTQTIFQSFSSFFISPWSHTKNMEFVKEVKSVWVTENTVNTVMTLGLGNLCCGVDQVDPNYKCYNPRAPLGAHVKQD